MKKIIEAAVMTVFGLIVLLTAIGLDAGMEMIVLGALGTVVGVIFLLVEIFGKKGK